MGGIPFVIPSPGDWNLVTIFSKLSELDVMFDDGGNVLPPRNALRPKP
jgi:hypothetical protein